MTHTASPPSAPGLSAVQRATIADAQIIATVEWNGETREH